MKLTLRVAVVLLTLACATQPQVGSPVTPVDPRLPQASAGDKGWEYVRKFSADLDGAGQLEQVVVIANAVLRNGAPLWDDAQIWQVYIVEADGQRTDLYRRWIQLGNLEVSITQNATVLMIENAPSLFAVYEAKYQAPGDVEVQELVKRERNPTAFVP